MDNVQMQWILGKMLLLVSDIDTIDSDEHLFLGAEVGSNLIRDARLDA